MTAENKNHFEIERKYLIVYPDESALQAVLGARVSDIIQTYLLSDKGERRVRKWTEQGRVTYISTYKEKTADSLRRIEIENVITEEEYNALLQKADPAMHSLCKRRYTIPYSAGEKSFVAEIDIYPFFKDRAILEIELYSEEEEVVFPPFVSVIREVTGETEYKNPVLARKYPYETE